MFDGPFPASPSALGRACVPARSGCGQLVGKASTSLRGVPATRGDRTGDRWPLLQPKTGPVCAAPQPSGGASTRLGRAPRAGRYQGGFRRGFLIPVVRWMECPHRDFFLSLCRIRWVLDLVRALLCCRRASRDSVLIVAVPNAEPVGGGSSFPNQKGASVAAAGSCATLAASGGAR